MPPYHPNYALNEIRALSLKAAKGAGLDWGLAEDAAFGTVFLCRYGFDGCGALIKLLDHLLQYPAAQLKPNHSAADNQSRILRATHGLSPLYAGITLLDRARQSNALPITLSKLHTPLFILPFIAELSKIWRIPLCAKTQHGTAHFNMAADEPCFSFIADDPQKWHIASDLMIKKSVMAVDRVTDNIPDKIIDKRRNIAHRAYVDEDIMREILRLAHKIYAPATEESRLKGAGAGVTDHD